MLSSRFFSSASVVTAAVSSVVPIVPIATMAVRIITANERPPTRRSAVNGVGAGALGLGGRLRGLQNGLIRSYALGIGIGAVLLLAYIVTRMNL